LSLSHSLRKDQGGKIKKKEGLAKNRSGRSARIGQYCHKDGAVYYQQKKPRSKGSGGGVTVSQRKRVHSRGGEKGGVQAWRVEKNAKHAAKSLGSVMLKDNGGQ